MPHQRQNLIWQPLFSRIATHATEHNQLLLLVSPFIKLEPLKRMLNDVQHSDDLKVVVRWRAEDILSDVSDLEIYPFLKQSRIPLYFNHRIHLKLYLLGANEAFHTSGNLTAKGLGYCEDCNIEVGCIATITAQDWVKLYELINSSRVVDDAIYEVFSKYYQENKKPANVTADLILPQESEKEFSLSALPASQNPEELWEYVSKADNKKYSNEQIRKCVHDLIIFQMPENLSEEAFFEHLRVRFKRSRFVQSIVEFIQEKGSCRFGEINSWIQRCCSDVPLPYKWEIKPNTNALYDWLEFFYEEITWDTPNYSQVIYWNRKLGAND